MAISCPSCGLANADDATECRRCRAPFAGAAEDISAGLGTLCTRCEAYNEPGVDRCTTCGYKLSPEPGPKPAAALKKGASDADDPPAPPVAPATRDGGPLWPGEVRATSPGVGAEQQGTRPAASRPRGWAAAEAAMADASLRRRTAAAAAFGVATPPSQPVLLLKACANCAAENPAPAKFCSECGTPFAKSAPPPADTPFAPEPSPPSATADAGDLAADDWAITTDPTGRPPPVVEEIASEEIELADPAPEPLGWDAAIGEAAASEEQAFASALAEAVSEPAATAPAAEPDLPYQASLVVERGNAAGTSFVLGQIENVLGGAGAPIELPEDPHLALRHAAVVFDEQRLLLRDEGSANGVYVKVRDSAPIEPGDYFVAGERLLRFDGPCELPVGDVGETPYLGAPRPKGVAARLTEILRGGKTGRVCFRSGPAIAIGRTGCDLNFGSDALLAARHAELRIAPDGSATLVDLNAAPSGVLLRLRPQQTIELQPGDVIQLGDQQLRLDVA
jgi:ribosomal protein L40E/pSer/pThr/pTyr-binding forkhead associated (FHA) protein